METFSQKCLKILTQIPKGKITTYKEIAHTFNTRAYRAVGTAMSKNQFLNKYPCYKVVKQNGEVGKYVGSENKKIELLKKDGIEIKNNKILNFEKVLFKSEEFNIKN